VGRFLLAVIAWALVGCSTSHPTHFYTLAPTAARATADAAQGQRPVIVAVGPVEVSAYLDRSQIVVREDQTRLRLADFHQWGEPLARNIARVIAENLYALHPQAHPIVQPWSDLPSDYKVVVKILRFDSDPQGRVRLRASWAVLDGKTRRYLAIRDSDISVSARSADYADIALAMSEALRELSEDIAQALRRHSADR
jgi:uncharacterized lipoprotein YmbA